MALLFVGASPRVFPSFPAHTHDCYEIILNIEGEGIARIGDRAYPFSPGTIHVIPPNTAHSKHAERGFRDLYVHTDTLLRTDLPGPAECPPEPLLLSDDANHTVEKLMSILLERYLQYAPGDSVMGTLFHAVLQLLADWRRDEPFDPVIHRLVHTIQASYNDPDFQVTDALLATGYSKDHLRRRFLRATGMTPNEYLRTVRIRYAKSLLLQRDKLRLPIKEIALMCGFYDPAYFCRSFHRETGYTPSEFPGEKSSSGLDEPYNA